MTAVLAGAAIGKHVTRHRAETKGIVKFAIDQQPGVLSPLLTGPHHDMTIRERTALGI
jgi:hypothetical protein